MDEFALTALCLTPSRLTWEEFHRRVIDFFTKDSAEHGAVSDLIAILGTTDDLRIARVLSLERALEAVRKDRTLRYWRRLSVNTRVSGVLTTISLLFLRLRDGTSQIEIRFPSEVNVAIQGKYFSDGFFNEDAKKSLVYLIVGLATKFEASGFGYRLADEDRLLGAADEDVVRRYVVKDSDWFGLPQRYMIAGIEASRMTSDEIELDAGEQPLRYAVGSYYLFDRLWPA